MNYQVAVRALVAAALVSGAVGSQAATMTLTKWTWGNGNNVNATAPSHGGASGGFTGTLTGSEIAGLSGAIDSYCIEIPEHFGFNNAYPNYTVLGASTYFSANPSKATALGRLISYVYGHNLFDTTTKDYRDDLSTSLQLAIWEIIYDTENAPHTLNSGVFSDTSAYRVGTGNFAGANTLLKESQKPGQQISYDLYVLSSGRPYTTSPGQQDQLIWRPSEVPEPASLALVALALGAAGAASRRRRA